MTYHGRKRWGRGSCEFSNGKYLKPISIIDCENKSIKEKAQDLTKRQGEIIEKAKSLFYFVRDEIK